ncbi:MAG: phage tail tube protein [Clostridia bacterium]|jgi:hypothetical protein|nr:phage tail tube protein [Clostridia bacterium]
MSVETKNVMSGTFGETWLDGEKCGEVYGLSAKIAYTREDIQPCGQMEVDSKLVSSKGTGSIKAFKMYSRFITKIAEKVKNGYDPRFTIISKVDDPDALGPERIAFLNCTFDDVTLADWESGKSGKIDTNFRFTKYKLLDTVEAE